MMEIPYNPLHERGFVSIGCEPCTRPVLPNQHEREGRWWGRSHPKECGLHAGNMKSIDIKTTGKSVVFYVMFRTQKSYFLL